jgi:hypothetical protein
MHVLVPVPASMMLDANSTVQHAAVNVIAIAVQARNNPPAQVKY